MKKKIFALIASVIITFSNFTPIFALTTIHESVEQEQISTGTVLRKYTRFTDKGWLEINVIEVDLEDNNTKVGLLNSENGLNTFQTVYQMADKDNIIAAINGDFFNGTYKNGNTIGLSISDGELLTSTYYENETKDTFGSFILDDDNNAWFDYFSNKITLKSKRGNEELPIGEYNKISSNYAYPVVYTSTWGEKSVGSTPDLILTELVVKDGKVKEIRENQEAVEIPKDGFVVSALGTAADYMKQNFKKGTKVELDIEMELDIDEVKMAVSGGAMLVEDGKVPEKFASNITGSHPRTAVGLSKDNEKVYLITVDGRQKKSIGMTQTELAEFLIEKGVYNALNLDGGGSTTMVARKPGESSIKTINSPSGGTLRMVTNAIGVYNTKKTSSLSKLIIKLPEENVFVGCERTFEVLGYDKYYNPVEIDLDEIDWSFEGVNVSIEDNKIIAGNEAGTAKITAKKGKVQTTISLDVLSTPNELLVTPKESTLYLGEDVEFEITAKNKNGYYASIENNELKYEVLSGDGEIVGNKYIPRAEGSHLISISAGNAVTYATVTVGASNEEILNDFETENFKFVSYPSAVKGDVELSNKEKYEGKKSAKLDYDFTTIDATRAAYLRFDEPIELTEDAKSVNFMVYSEEEKVEDIKLKMIDAKGTTVYALVNEGIPSGEWTKISYDLTNISLPATLTDIYVAQDNKDEKNKGTIYVDNLSIVTETCVELLKTKAPEDKKGEDLAQKESEYDSGDSLKIVIYDELRKSNILLDQLTTKRAEEQINALAEVAIFTSQSDVELLKSITAETILCGEYSKKEIENSMFITLDISNGGIRNTNYEQWLNIQEDVKSSNQKNIFIVMNDSLDEFTDSKEKQLFIDVLCELRRNTVKNIWVIHRGSTTTYSMERGVKYLSIGNELIDKKEPLDVAQKTKYMIITVAENELSYEIKNVFEK